MSPSLVAPREHTWRYLKHGVQAVAIALFCVVGISIIAGRNTEPSDNETPSSTSTSSVRSRLGNMADPFASLQMSPDINFYTIAAYTLVLAGSSHAIIRGYAAISNSEKQKHFDFMKLPPELRAQVFEYLLEPPAHLSSLQSYFQMNRTRRRQPITTDWPLGSFLNKAADFGFLRDNFNNLLPAYQPSTGKYARYLHINNMTLVSSQFRAEFMESYLKHTRPIFTLDASATPTQEPNRAFFELPQESFDHIRHCTLRILATPGIAGAFDPRAAKIADWTLKDEIFTTMRSMRTLKSLALVIEASGNSMWNPVALWHFLSQAFKESTLRAFNRIDFEMRHKEDGLSLGHLVMPSNHLERDEKTGAWGWRCSKGHFLTEDLVGVTPVRRFCDMLYDCQVCDPPSAGEEEATGGP